MISKWVRKRSLGELQNNSYDHNARIFKGVSYGWDGSNYVAQRVNSNGEQTTIIGGATGDIEDSLTGGLIVVDHSVAEIHEGNHYYMEGYTTLNNGDTLYVKLVTPDSDVVARFRWEINSGGVLTTELYEGVSGGMTGGSSVTPLNNDRNSANTSVMTITSGVTVATDLGTTISKKKVGGTTWKNVSGGSDDKSDEILLKKNTTYLRKFLSGSDSNTISFRAHWHEH